MLAAIGLDRTKVYIANMVPWRPPGNRDPSPEELALCTPFLVRQVELVAPKLLVTLGNVPTKSLFDTTQGITADARAVARHHHRDPRGEGAGDAASGLSAADTRRQVAGLAGHAEPQAGAVGTVKRPRVGNSGKPRRVYCARLIDPPEIWSDSVGEFSGPCAVA